MLPLSGLASHQTDMFIQFGAYRTHHTTLNQCVSCPCNTLHQQTLTKYQISSFFHAKYLPPFTPLSLYTLFFLLASKGIRRHNNLHVLLCFTLSFIHQCPRVVLKLSFIFLNQFLVIRLLTYGIFYQVFQLLIGNSVSFFCA